MTPPIIHWFRRDLRLSDHLALAAAAAAGGPILPIFIYDPALLDSPRLSRPRLKFLLAGLAALDEAIRARGGRLLYRVGEPGRVLRNLAQVSGARALMLSRDYTPYARRRDERLAEAIGIPVYAYDDALLAAPGTALTDARQPYTVFTPFRKRWLSLPKSDSVATPAPGLFVPPQAAAALNDHPHTERAFLHGIPHDRAAAPADFGQAETIAIPQAGEDAAQARLAAFIARRIADYDEGRHRLPALSADDSDGGTSFLSPYLRLGLLSPRQAYWAAQAAYPTAETESARKGIEAWVSELIWREFYMHVLYHFPHVMRGSFRPEYDALQWREAPDEFAAWQAGMTGYPVVDAAMRQLTAMGWLPNRARMIVASFLTKDLLIDWRRGERHFMDWLIDGDPAANNGGWQWTAGVGTDASPYFRIFNPVAQSQKFDPDGVYLRRWLPELRDVPTAHLHTPWTAPTPPKGYPPPIVDHGFARERTLAAFQRIKEVVPYVAS